MLNKRANNPAKEKLQDNVARLRNYKNIRQ